MPDQEPAIQKTSPDECPTKKFRNITLAVVFIFLLIKNILFVFSLPPWQGHDEPAHFSYTQYLVEEKKLPNQSGAFEAKTLSYSYEYAASEVATDSTRLMNAHNKELRTIHQRFTEEFLPYGKLAQHYDNLPRHPLARSSAPPGLSDIYYRLPANDSYQNSAAVYPPLYYIVESIPYLIYYHDDIIIRQYAMRLFSSLLFLLGYWLCFVVARRLTKNFFLSLTVMLTVGLLPVFSHLAAGINNDALLFVLTTLSLYFLVRLIERFEMRPAVWLGLTFGLGLLTKPQFIVVPLLILIPAVYHVYYKKDIKIKTALAIIAVCAAITICISGWWYVWAVINDNGIIGSRTALAPADQPHITAGLAASVYIQRWMYAFASFNFAFGFATEMILPLWFFISGTALWIVSAIGIILFVIVKRKKLTSDQCAIGAVFLASVILLEIFFLYLFTHHLFRDGQARFPIDGRYYVPVLLPICFGWIVGLTGLLPNTWKKYGYIFFILYGLTANALALAVTIWPKLYL
ncbi:MAG: DUF2142 domain-containing protein [Patescibacteria group bacterium]